MVRKNCALDKLFQNNSVRMGGKEVGDWVAAYLDKNLDLLLRMTSSVGSNGPVVDQWTSDGSNIMEEPVVVNHHQDPLNNGDMEEEIMADDELDRSESQMLHLVKLETDTVQSLDEDVDAIDLQSNQMDSHFGREASQWTESYSAKWEEMPEEKKKRKKFSLRDDPLRLVCGWWFCGQEFAEWPPFHEHVMSHLKEVRKGFLYDMWEGHASKLWNVG